MTIIGDYKSYKKYANLYPDWKFRHDLAEAKRAEYLKRNPNDFNPDDLQRSHALLRAIDIMDEASQKKAENMEVITEQVVGMGLELALTVGAGLGFVVSLLKPVKNFFAKFAQNGKKSAMLASLVSMTGGMLISTAAAFPLYAWAAKAEVSASRRGRFEAMRTDLANPKTFAVLTPDQEQEVQKALAQAPKKKKKIPNPLKSLKENIHSLKEMAFDSDEYKYQKLMFDYKLQEDANLIGSELTEKETEDAKHDQQILTKLVEKIDIASQDYAENAELATSALTTCMFGFGALFSMLYEKAASKMKWKPNFLPHILSLAAVAGSGIFAASIQKEASRVGRFKIKQELMKNPESLYYVSDEKAEKITDVEPKPYKKTGMIKFLINAWKNDREYKKWKKTEGEKEKILVKTLEQLEMSDEQIKDAKRLQHNTFKTFNAVDENSQKYSESIEALGQALQTPLAVVFTTIGAAFGLKYLTKSMKSNVPAEQAKGFIKYTMSVLLSSLPLIGVNAYITREQKNASRVADMLAINELSDYRQFADYSRIKNS